MSRFQRRGAIKAFRKKYPGSRYLRKRGALVYGSTSRPSATSKGMVAPFGRLRRPDGAQSIYYHCRQFYYGEIVHAAGGGNLGGAMSFSINQLPDHTDFTNLYDSYWLYKVIVTFRPKFTSYIPLSSGQVWTNSRVYLVEDNNDATPVPATGPGRDSLLACQNCRIYDTVGPSFSIVIYPKPLPLSQEQTASGQNWMSCAAPNASFYGLKYWIGSLQMDEYQPLFDVTAKYYMRFKNVQ